LPPTTLPLGSKVMVPNVWDVGSSSPLGVRRGHGQPAALRARIAGLCAGCPIVRRQAFDVPRLRQFGVGLILAGIRFLAALELLEAELVVFLHFPDLLLHLVDLEIQFLDTAIESAKLLFEICTVGSPACAISTCGCVSLRKTPGSPLPTSRSYRLTFRHWPQKRRYPAPMQKVLRRSLFLMSSYLAE
jgi:hypothetical protein